MEREREREREKEREREREREREQRLETGLHMTWFTNQLVLSGSCSRAAVVFLAVREVCPIRPGC